MNTEEISVVNAYNNEIVKLGNHAVRFTNPKTEDQVRQYLKWCKNNEVSPVEFLRTIIQGTKQKPKWGLGRLGNKGSLSMWDDLRGVRADLRETRRLHREMQARPTKSFQLRPQQENFKANFLLDPDLCMVQSQYSGGWNPKSTYCRRCGKSRPCKEG